MSESKRGGGCALLVVGFALGWVFATATRPDQAAYEPPAAYEAPARSDLLRETLPAPAEVSEGEIAPPPAPVEPIEETPAPIVAESTPREIAQALDVAPGPSDSDIRTLIIERSLNSYPGSCPCPYNIDRAGRRCGGRSAYSRPGGAAPLCYPSDVTDADVQRFRSGRN